MPMQYTPEVEQGKPIKTSFWVGLGLDMIGAVFIGLGVSKNVEVKENYDKYNSYDLSRKSYEYTWSNVEKAKSERNTYYILGGIILASGIGVHIWF